MRSTLLPDEIRRMMVPKLAREFYGPSSGVFIGSEGYPSVNAGALGMLAEQPEPSSMLNMSYGDILSVRAAVIRSARKENIFSKERLVGDMQQIALAALPTDVEMIFFRKPTFSMNFDKILQPMGLSAKLEKLRITENPKIDGKVEKIASDDIKASEASSLLYASGVDVYKITTILSSGALGMKKKLVPTRWSITAIDDIITKSLLKDVRGYKSVSEFMVFESLNLDNRFVALLMPGSWEFENFESWPSGPWAGMEVEYEPFSGRTSYADKQAGGYYASRLGIVEHLQKIKRQARVVVFREIYEGYSVPLGVWQVRENVRNAMRQEPRKFSDMKSALAHVSTRLKWPMQMYMNKSSLLKQKRLNDF